MADLADGYYIIHNVANSNMVLSKQGNWVENGTNILVANLDYTPAQIVRVLTMADNTRRILFRDCGKAVDVALGNIDVDGTNIQIYASNDSRAQKVSFSECGTTTYSGNTYTTYYIKWQSDKVAKAAGTNHGDNVTLEANTAHVLEQWFFEEIPQIRDGQSYRILSVLNTDYCLEVAGNSSANGANVSLGKYNSRPNQIWVLENTVDGWAIRNPQSGLYMDVAGGTPAEKTNVQIWNDNDTRAQRWKLLGAAATSYHGKTYSTHNIGSFVTPDGMTYMVDVDSAQAAANTNVQIWLANGTDAQAFLFFPTNVEDPSLPVPFDLSFAEDIGEPGKSWVVSQDRVYPTWGCSASWTDFNANHFEFRARNRYMRSESGTWTEWGEPGTWAPWSEWAPAYVEKDGNRAWLSEGLDARIQSNISPLIPTKWYHWKHGQIEFQVRAANVESRHSKIAGAIVDIVMVPECSVSDSVWDPEGLHIEWSSDYTYGTTFLTITDITDGHNNSILRKPYRLSGDTYGQIGVVPFDYFTRYPSDGDLLTIKWLAGYDQMEYIPGTPSSDLITCVYGTGRVPLSYTVEHDDDSLDWWYKIEDHDTTRAWLEVDGELFECQRDMTRWDASAYAYFVAPYPMGKFSRLHVISYSDDYSVWSMETIGIGAKPHIAHGWTWSSGSLYLHKHESALPVTDIIFQPVYETNTLDSRKRETLSFAPTTSVTFTATGALIHDADYSTLDDVKALLEARHAIYRDINGGVHYVGITNITVTQHEKYDSVTVTMTEETI